jgi:hypothetical protein
MRSPLQLYLYIFNRTRMIRKDFNMQDLQPDGAEAQFRASLICMSVNERIARWHIVMGYAAEEAAAPPLAAPSVSSSAHVRGVPAVMRDRANLTDRPPAR